MTPDHLDLLVLYAATSDRTHRTLLMQQLAKKLNVPEPKLWRRLKKLEAPKALSHSAGKSAIDQYEKRLRAILQMRKLESKLGLRLDEQISSARARYSDSCSVADVAKILRVNRSVVCAWIRDLWVLQIDENGRVPKQELRRFLTSENAWIAIPSKRGAASYFKVLRIKAAGHSTR